MPRESDWGAPRIHGELLKLGIDVGETSVSKYMVRRRNPPSQTWRTFLENHVKDTVSIDFFTVATIRFQVLYVFLVLAHDRRRIVHFNVTAHPTAEWTGQQLREAFPFEKMPRYLLRDRDGIIGGDFTKEVRSLGIEEVLSAPRSPWQSVHERVIGSIRREAAGWRRRTILVNGPAPSLWGRTLLISSLGSVGGGICNTDNDAAKLLSGRSLQLSLFFVDLIIHSAADYEVGCLYRFILTRSAGIVLAC